MKPSATALQHSALQLKSIKIAFKGKGMDTLSGEATLSGCPYPFSEKWSSLNGEN